MTRKILLLILFIGLFTAVFGQQKMDTNHSTHLTILVVDIDKADGELSTFINKHELVPSKYNRKKREINVTLLLNKTVFFELKRSVQKWGFVEFEDSKAINHFDSMQKLKKEINLLEDEKAQYIKLVGNIDSTSNERYFDYWEKIITLDREIAKLYLERETIDYDNARYSFDLILKEEISTNFFYGNSWVNMPGLEYSFLRTEQAEAGTSPQYMHGLSLKYLFNWYKSYALVGLYKNADPKTNSEIDETYIFAIGQDFYSRRMGRGQRKFFNIYSSFNTGLYISSSETQQITSWFVNPFLGVEIFKNRNILIDNKVGYFLPYKSNRTQRGLIYNFSFNFIL